MGWLPWSSGDSNKALTVAASRRTGQVMHAARRVEMPSSAAWTGMVSWMESKMTRKLVGNAQKRPRSLRQLVRRPGYVKYFEEKRVIEYNRDKTIERIKKEDADKMKESKTQGWKSS
ncbi:Cytochrome c oxidase assembly factor 6 [Penicillium sp. IBT 35674x]|nr:Cytochrome c oxidase assembly factor 6 [Penicillium sp. IBT 35674x]